MKFNFIALTTLSCICLGLSSVSPTRAMYHEATKGGNGHHEHETPHSSDTSESSMPMHEDDDATPSSNADNTDMSSDGHGDTHGEEVHEGGAHGGASNDAHHGGHGHHNGMAAGPPWFHHGAIEVSDVFHVSMANAQEPLTDMGMAMPSVMVMVYPDAHKGWNIEVQTEHFTFAPEQVNQANQPNMGHGHLYVDGEKITRLYGAWFYLESLEHGSHEITVSLHANGHEVWTHEGEAIAHTTTIEVP